MLNFPRIASCSIASRGRQAKEQWLEIQDLFVEERSPQMIFLSESYIQIWERKDITL